MRRGRGVLRSNPTLGNARETVVASRGALVPSGVPQAVSAHPRTGTHPKDRRPTRSVGVAPDAGYRGAEAAG